MLEVLSHHNSENALGQENGNGITPITHLRPIRETPQHIAVNGVPLVLGVSEGASAPAIAPGILAAYMHAARFAVVRRDSCYRCTAARSAILACRHVAVIEGEGGIPS